MYFNVRRLAFIALTLPWQGSAQAGQATTTAVCSTLLWTSNQDNLSPCVVASALQAVCNGGTWSIPAIGPTSQYSGPSAGQSNTCACSTVVYSLVAACGACQGAGVATWNIWRMNCTSADVTIAHYPLSLPPNVTVPDWAYIDPTTQGGVWDSSAALADHNVGNADHTASAVSSTNTSTTAGSSPSASTSSSTKKKINAGAIAGGVVGGVVFLALLAIGAFFFIRRRRSVASKSSFDQNGSSSFNNNEKTNNFGAPVAPVTHPLPIQSEPPRLYDPSDPSTFPTSPSPSLPPYGYPNTGSFVGTSINNHAASLYPTSNSPAPSMPSTAHPYTVAGNQGGYTGVPEV